MLKQFGDTVVQAYGNTYTLDLRSINDVQRLSLITIAVAIISILVVARHFRVRSALYSLGWGALALLFYGGYLKLGSLPIYAHTHEGYIFNLYWPELRYLLTLVAAVTGLCACAGAALYCARPAALRESSWEKQQAKLWPRTLLMLPLLMLWVLSMGGLDVAEQLHKLSYVPALEFPPHARVQVGYPFVITPHIRQVGTTEWHLFSKPTPKYLHQEDLTAWQLPSAPFVATQTGDNLLKFRMTRKQPLRFSVERTFHIEAGEERGSPLVPLVVGNTWRYHATKREDSEQTLIQAFQKNDELAKDAQSVVLRVNGASVSDGVRSFELSVDESAELEKDATHKTYKLTMWEGETWVEYKDQRVPLLTRMAGPVPGGESLYPCWLAVLPRWDGCLCNDHPLDARRRLPGLARCMEQSIETHNTNNLLTIGLGMLTLGLSSVGRSPLRIRGNDTYYVGLLSTESGTN